MQFFNKEPVTAPFQEMDKIHSNKKKKKILSNTTFYCYTLKFYENCRYTDCCKSIFSEYLIMNEYFTFYAKKSATHSCENVRALL